MALCCSLHLLWSGDRIALDVSRIVVGGGGEGERGTHIHPAGGCRGKTVLAVTEKPMESECKLLTRLKHNCWGGTDERPAHVGGQALKEGAHVGETHASATPSPRMPQPSAQGGWKSRRERAGGGRGELRAAGQRNILVMGARGRPAGKEAGSVLNSPLKLGVIVSSHDSIEALDLPSRPK